jgi:PKD repeat protein
MKAFTKVSFALCAFLAIVILTPGTTVALIPIDDNTTNPPIADFSYAKSCNIFYFTDLSTNADSVECDLGDGSTEYIEPGEEFTHLYQNAGTYKVIFVAYKGTMMNSTSCYVVSP